MVFIVLVIIIPLVKFFLELLFGITLRNDAKIILTYFYTYFIFVMIAILIVRKNSFSLISTLFLLTYGIVLFIGNGLDGLNYLNELPSPNNQNVLLVNIQSSWYPGANVRFYTKVGPFLQKTIRTPVMDSTFDNNKSVDIDLSWKDDNTIILSGDIAINNMMNFKRAKERFPDKCDYEIIDDKFYLNLP